jgi:hypothetical protein
MKSLDKLKSFLEKYTREVYFQERIEQIRKEIGIPPNGAKIPKKQSKIDSIFLILGFKYNGVSYPTFPAKRPEIYNEILRKIPKPYQQLLIIKFINYYILYNKRNYSVFNESIFSSRNTVELVEYRTDFLEMEGLCDCSVKVCEDYMKNMSKDYPVIIGVSPYASQNEVISLIKDKWDCIQVYMQKLIEDKDIDFSEDDKKILSQLRQRSPESKEIEDIVYNNKGLSLNEISNIVKDKTGKRFDQGEIGKIKSLAIKRRNKNRK